MGNLILDLPPMEIRGIGTFTPPPLTDDDLAAIKLRADAVADDQLRTDLFRLMAEVERLTKD